MLQHEEDQQGEATDEPVRRVRKRVRTGPICIGGIGFGRSGGRGGHGGPSIRRDGARVRQYFLVRG